MSIFYFFYLFHPIPLGVHVHQINYIHVALSGWVDKKYRKMGLNFIITYNKCIGPGGLRNKFLNLQSNVTSRLRITSII